MGDERKPITYEKAIEMIGDGERIHTFRNPAAGLMLGADWDREDLLASIKNMERNSRGQQPRA